MTRSKHTFRLPPALADQLAEYAIRKRVSQALVVETALASFLSPDGTERMEAAFSRRMDKLQRSNDRLQYHVEVGNEALALFVRFWLTANPPLPESARAAAQAQAKDRYDGFVEALTRKLETSKGIVGEFPNPRR
ncbi:MAG: CopG family transcriptional regulator [Novosphingobium sp. 17-62-19]|uniref:CopG family transcriptional regulator n=1 Tax=Novosphingobium sp. 17-62-19 TaxID=1970406 RepID=UPI000BC593EE|nr:CopG family transcriptional regulator [Novosphingobium sp. 17-62-19]OZA21425.1 MAG: CopG family transcriptional regulator [Novosphingobium sp. 17-62-19]HQS96074.1 CopG family transcriptional regulator [Novosphingobium sp.]